MKIEALTEMGWWVMPYRFENAADRDEFLTTLRMKNPGREFRVLP